MTLTNKGEDYFNNAINTYNRRIESYNLKLLSGDLNQTQRERRGEMLFDFYIKKIALLYSTKTNKTELIVLIEDFLEKYEEFNLSIYGAYEEVLWLISIYYCLDMRSNKIDILISDIEEEGFNDMLVSSIINGIRNDYKTTSNFEFDKPYKRLQGILTSKENADIVELKKYLTNYWYKESSDATWHNTHKDKSGYDYVGYWSFESAALVKLYGLDDSILKEVDYYPYDLLRLT